jgi:hypothetical protein
MRRFEEHGVASRHVSTFSSTPDSTAAIRIIARHPSKSMLTKQSVSTTMQHGLFYRHDGALIVHISSKVAPETSIIDD